MYLSFLTTSAEQPFLEQLSRPLSLIKSKYTVTIFLFFFKIFYSSLIKFLRKFAKIMWTCKDTSKSCSKHTLQMQIALSNAFIH